MLRVIFLILFLPSPASFAFLEKAANPMLMPHEVKFNTPLRFYTENIYEANKEREALNIQLGVEKQFYSNSLKNTVSIETNFAFPLYNDINAVDWSSLDAGKIITPMQLPSDLQLGVNFKLFF